MTQSDITRSAAKYLAKRWRDLDLWGRMPEELRPRSIEEAYEIQDQLAEIRSEYLGPVVGFKIAMTSPVMQDLLGIHEPVSGVIHENSVLRSPALVRASDYMQVGVECEIAVRLGTSLGSGSAPHTPESVVEAIEAVMPAFEIIDIHPKDMEGPKPYLPEVIAANAAGAGMVLGAPMTDWRVQDLGGTEGAAFINGELVGHGAGRDVLGHPFAALAWLGNHLQSRGRSVAARSTIITGSIVATKVLKAGDVATFELGECEPVRLDVH